VDSEENQEASYEKMYDLREKSLLESSFKNLLKEIGLI
jgi:hypothetical protein